MAAAQPQPFGGKAAITLTFGGQPGSENASRTTTFPLYGEEARIDTTHEIGGGFLFDIGGSYKVWENIGVGLSYSRVGSTSDATISGQVPHPDFTNSPRTFSAAANDLEHAENAIHLQAIWFYQYTDKIEFSAFVGPSFYTVTQDFNLAPDAGDFTETPPFNSVTLNNVDIVSLKESAAGFNIGGDASYAFTKSLSGVFSLRYSHASADFNVDGQTVSLDVGNAQIGAGVRIRF
jgi:hypothetical protein